MKVEPEMETEKPNSAKIKIETKRGEEMKM
jgi:hypothetical protein